MVEEKYGNKLNVQELKCKLVQLASFRSIWPPEIQKFPGFFMLSATLAVASLEASLRSCASSSCQAETLRMLRSCWIQTGVTTP